MGAWRWPWLFFADGCTLTVYVQEAAAPAETPAAEAAAAETPAADAAEAPAEEAAAEPELPAYFTPSTGGEAPVWPDAGGGAAGYWTTPSGGPVGDGDPSGKTPKDLYDRIAHNLFSINMVWVMLAAASW